MVTPGTGFAFPALKQSRRALGVSVGRHAANWQNAVTPGKAKSLRNEAPKRAENGQICCFRCLYPQANPLRHQSLADHTPRPPTRPQPQRPSGPLHTAQIIGQRHQSFWRRRHDPVAAVNQHSRPAGHVAEMRHHAATRPEIAIDRAHHPRRGEIPAISCGNPCQISRALGQPRCGRAVPTR